MICNECETVAHCTKHGCVPKQPAPVSKDEALDLALETLESIQAAYPCETVGKRIAAIKQARSAPVQEPVRWSDYEPDGRRYPSVPDAMTSADIQEHIEYVAGWNDCRQAMMEMMK